ncbi:hypothetical protein [Polyangium sp. 15x6]|uniref:hypothetical protein n=1 Tax=Polyangium sp. 15x6 TaxID=3042687 RepID=UPI00249B6839|nr:hypothetical protein [Polyangium sp. 15x6]MDI3290365.1 hypothetical protein [Polyangium sp. 15x6]
MAQDILIIVNAKTGTVQMYAADPSIVQGNSQGSNELWVRVPASEQLRWRVEPLQLAEGASGEADLYHAIITRVELWGPTESPPQGDASKYLVDWISNNGAGDTPYYSAPGTITAGKNTFGPPTPIATQGINRPFVACETQMSNRDEMVSPKIAYSFSVDIYLGREKVNTVTWDPYVTVYRP